LAGTPLCRRTCPPCRRTGPPVVPVAAPTPIAAPVVPTLVPAAGTRRTVVGALARTGRTVVAALARTRRTVVADRTVVARSVGTRLVAGVPVPAGVAAPVVEPAGCAVVAAAFPFAETAAGRTVVGASSITRSGSLGRTAVPEAITGATPTTVITAAGVTTTAWPVAATPRVTAP